MNTREIVDNVRLLLAIDGFGDRILVNTENLMRQGGVDEGTRSLVYAIQLKMTEFDLGNINEENLCRELASTIQPYE